MMNWESNSQFKKSTKSSVFAQKKFLPFWQKSVTVDIFYAKNGLIRYLCKKTKTFIKNMLTIFFQNCSDIYI